MICVGSTPTHCVVAMFCFFSHSYVVLYCIPAHVCAICACMCVGLCVCASACVRACMCAHASIPACIRTYAQWAKTVVLQNICQQNVKIRGLVVS